MLGAADAGVGTLVGGCLDVVLFRYPGVGSQGTGDEDPGFCFSLATSMEKPNGGVPRRTRRGLGSRGSDLRVSRRDAECWMPLMQVLELLWVVVLLLACPLCPFHRRCRVGVYGLTVLYPRRGSWDPCGRLSRCCPARGISSLDADASESMISLFPAPNAGVGTLVGGCLDGLDVVLLASPFPSALSCQSL